MSGPFGSSQWMYKAGDFYSFPIEQSLKFNDGDAHRLVWTPSSDGDRLTWTFSFWTKRANLGAVDGIFSAATSITNNTTLRWHDTNGLQLYHYDSGSLAFNKITAPVFRDTSSWYHFVVVYDSTEATASDRVKMWVNGEAITSWYTDVNPSLNKISDFGLSGRPHYIGSIYSSSNCLDGYMAEVNFVDGQALTPTDFGETKSGVWIPKEYTGTYGTDGFHLTFADSSNIGNDTSGNGNDWSIRYFAATDVLPDSPTNNFAVMNPLWKSSNTVLEEGNLYLPSRGYYSNAVGTMGVSSGKWYFEARVGNNYGSYNEFGVIATDDKTFINQVSGGLTSNVTWHQLSYIYSNGTLVTNPTSPSFYNTSTKIVGCAIDLDNNKVYFHGNGTWLNSSDPDTNTGGTTIDAAIQGKTFVPLVGTNNVSASPNTWVNFGQDGSFAGTETAQGNTDENGYGDFYYAPPSGYLALCTANLPDPVIDPAKDDIPSDYFNTVLWTGDGTSSRPITGVGFQPDMVWTKRRSGADNHHLFDSVRVVSSVPQRLFPNLTNAEDGNFGSLDSFDSDGFTIGSNVATNESGATFAGWSWLAGNGTSSNTSGSITSTVSVNQKAGFSIIGYTGNGTAGATVGHGLGVAPELLIFKNRDVARNWLVYLPNILGVGNSDYLMLDQTGAEGFAGAVNCLNSTSPSSSVITLGDDANTNENTKNFICYAFTGVEGYSKFGKYTGNGSADGPMIFTGHSPAFLMVKRTDSSGDWFMFDKERATYNVVTTRLWANLASAELSSSVVPFDFLSNGFKVRNADASFNANGGTYIYMAFAESPFKYSNAR